MEPDYKKYIILYVDDEEKSLKYFSRLMGKKFNILTCESAEAAQEIIKERHHEIGIVFTDQRMPGKQGVDFLEEVRNNYPEIIRILVTAYADMDAAIASVNRGEIYRYVSKPWEIPELEMTLTRAMEHFMLKKEVRQLMSFKLNSMFQLLVSDRVLSLGLLCHLPEFPSELDAANTIRNFLNIADFQEVANATTLNQLNDTRFFNSLLAQQKDFLRQSYELFVATWGDSEIKDNDREILNKYDSLINEAFGELNEKQLLALAYSLRVISDSHEPEVSVKDQSLLIANGSLGAIRSMVSSLFNIESKEVSILGLRLLNAMMFLDASGLECVVSSYDRDAPLCIRKKTGEANPKGSAFIDNVIADESLWARLMNH